VAVAHAQPPRPPEGGSLVDRMMALDKNKDGKLSKDEVTDERMQRLFERADANKDGVVTKEELTAFAAQAPGGGRPGGGGFGGFGGRPQPGQVMPPFLAETLKLTDDQKKQLADLQKEVDAKLDKILTEEQKKQLTEMRERGGRPGGEGGRPGRPGGEGRRPGGEGGRPERPR
jgi:hypothetical protein